MSRRSLRPCIACLCTILSLALALALDGCASAPTDSPSGEATEASATHEVKDTTGRTVSLPATIGHIVALDPADAEIICALGAQETLVGRSAWCDYPPEIEDVPVVASGAETNVEEILGHDPDLVVMSTMAQSSAVADQLEAASVPTLVFETTTIEGIYENIQALGSALGRESQADQLVEEMKDKLAQAQEIASKRNDSEQPVIYFEVSPLKYALWTAGKDTFMQEAADLLGATNAFSDLSGWASISEEQVIDHAPTYIITTATDEGAAEEIMSRTGWEKIPAVAQGHVLAIPDDMLTRPGPRVADAIVMIAEFLGKDA